MNPYSFDPTHGYSLDQLLQVEPPAEPADFAEFWKKRYRRAMDVLPNPRLRDTGVDRDGWRVFDLALHSTDNTELRGWALLPVHGTIRRGFVIGHGYGGRDAPDFDLPLDDAALFFPCARGLGRSWNPYISSESHYHVLHDIQSRRRYVHGGCVEDLWVTVTALLRFFPRVVGHIGYIGESFGGGIGTMALAWDERISRAHLIVPSFGHHPLRLRLPSTGSAASVQQFAKRHPSVVETLAYFDAAVAARRIRIPVLAACAKLDPAVAPPGQFAIHNALGGPKELFVLEAGHHDWPGAAAERERLRQKIHDFFRDI